MSRDVLRTMTDNARLAVLLRTVQWELDEVAFALPRGEVTPPQRARLAQNLATLADLSATSVRGEIASVAAVTADDTDVLELVTITSGLSRRR